MKSAVFFVLMVVGPLLPLAAQTTNAPLGANTNNVLALAAHVGISLTNPPLATMPPTQAIPVDVEALLKYQELLRTETDQHAARLNELIQHAKDLLTAFAWGIGTVGGLIVVIAVVAAWFLNYFGRSTFKESAEAIKVRFDKEADGRLQHLEAMCKDRVEEMVKEFRETSRSSFDTRLAQIEETYRRRQAKYLKLLRSYFSKLFETNPELRSQWLGPEFNDGRFRGKRILWVDDDGVGIALLVELLVVHCGVHITIRESTSEALAESMANYDLVISNLRRDPDDNAGILMTAAIRKQKQSNIPIIIFTRNEHKRFYGEAIHAAGASGIATSEKEVVGCIADMLNGAPLNGKKA